MTDELEGFSPYDFEAALTLEDLESHNIKEYPTAVEAWQHPAQIVFSDKFEDLTYYHSPTVGPPFTNFIAFPKTMAEEDVESLLPHELAHEKLRHGHVMDPVTSVSQEIEAILTAGGYKGSKEFEWSDRDKYYFVQILLSLPTEPERRLAVQSAVHKLGYIGGVPWPYEYADRALPGWIHTRNLEDEDKFEKWMLNMEEDLGKKLKRSRGRRRKNK